jgi:dTDP-4-dehydrorhamnose 3,5-epimerase
MGSEVVHNEIRIDGLIITPLKQMKDVRGAVYHFLRSDSPNFKNFGEAYFSIVFPSVVKGWKIHSQIHQNFCVPHGAIKFVVFDRRDNSPSKGIIQEVILDNQENYNLLSMPCGLWYSFKCISLESSLISNIIDMPHSPEESRVLPINTNEIPYVWK